MSDERMTSDYDQITQYAIRNTFHVSQFTFHALIPHSSFLIPHPVEGV